MATVELFINNDYFRDAVNRIYVYTKTTGTIYRIVGNFPHDDKITISGINESEDVTIWLTYNNGYYEDAKYKELRYRYDSYTAPLTIITPSSNDEEITISSRDSYDLLIISFIVEEASPPTPTELFWKFVNGGSIGNIGSTPKKISYDHSHYGYNPVPSEYRSFTPTISGQLVETNSKTNSWYSVWVYDGDDPEAVQLHTQGSSNVYFIKGDGKKIPSIGRPEEGWYLGSSNYRPTGVNVTAGKRYWIFCAVVDDGVDPRTQNYYEHELTLYINGEEPKTDPSVIIPSSTITDTTATINLRAGTVDFNYYVLFVRKSTDASDVTYQKTFPAGDRVLQLTNLIPETEYVVNIGLSNNSSGDPIARWVYTTPPRFVTTPIIPSILGVYFDTGTNVLQPKKMWIDTGTAFIEVKGFYMDDGVKWISHNK